MPLISIILPTYNVEKYIARALESCINQTLKDIEIIVVDDKGQDNSIDIAKNYASNDDRIKIIHNKENLKLLHARAEGVKVAKSELIMFLDPDDELELNACEIAYNAMVNGGGIVDFLCFKMKILKNNILLYEQHFIDAPQSKIYIKEYIELFKQSGYDAWGWNLNNKIYKKELYLKAFYTMNTENKINMAEDALMFYFILIQSSNYIFFINQSLYIYHLNESSITQSKNKINSIKEHEIVFDIINKHNNSFKEYYLFYLYDAFWKNICNDLKYHKEHLNYLKSIKHKHKKYYKEERLKIHKLLKNKSLIHFLYYIFFKFN